MLALSPSDRAEAGETLAATLSSLPLLRGAPVTSESFEDTVVLVAFFASWCPPCKHEFPHLNTVQRAYADQGLRIIAVNVFETFDGLSTQAKLELFLDDVDPAFPILKGDADTRRVAELFASKVGTEEQDEALGFYLESWRGAR